MIVVTGGAGFIGSNLVNHLSKTKNIASIDWNNEVNKEYFKSKKIEQICPSNIDTFLKKHSKFIEIIVHLGAITSTTEKNINLLLILSVWQRLKNRSGHIYLVTFRFRSLRLRQKKKG